MKKILFLSVLLILSCNDEYFIQGIEEVSNSPMVEEVIVNPLPSDPIVWFPFNGNTNDESGNALNGVLYEGEYTACRSLLDDSSLQLNIDDNPSWGEENDRVEVDYSPLLNSNNLTISAWVNLNGKVGRYSNRSYSIVSRWDYENNGTPDERISYAFFINPDLNIEFGGKGQVINSDIPITLNEWYHVAITIDSWEVKIYLNGSLIHKEDVNGDLTLPNNDNNLILGERRQYNGYWYHFDGKLDDVGMWGRALTPCEINDLYKM